MTERERALDALRIELAEALGYEVKLCRGDWTAKFGGEQCTVHEWYEIWEPGRTLEPHPIRRALGIKAVWAVAMAYGVIPDWPRDDGAALALCVKFAAGLWEIYICPAPDGERCAVALVSSRGRVDAFGATPAEALSRLALAAMRGEA